MADLSADLASLKIDRDRNPNRRGPLRYLIIVGVIFAFVLLVYFVVLPYVESKVFKVEVSVSEISLVSPAQAQIELTSTGYVQAQRVSRVAAVSTGKVARVAVVQGQRVEAGAVLFELEIIDQQAAIASAKARAAATWARAQVARANLAEIQLQAERATDLAKKGIRPGAVAADLRARVASLRQQVRAADADANAAKAEVKALEVNLNNFVVKAPIAGTVLSEPPAVGEVVGPQPAGVTTDFGNIEIADFDTLIVQTDVPEGRLHMVKIGGPCEISLDAFPRARYRGKTLEIVPRVNRAKATVSVKVSFLDPVEGVLPDMSARVNFLSKGLDPEALKEPPKLVVPADAVVERSGASVVFVLEDDRVRMVPVTVAGAHAAGFELVRGPPAGTRVVKRPPDGLSDGQAVEATID